MTTQAIINLIARLDQWRQEKSDQIVLTDYAIHQSRKTGTLTRRSALTATEVWNQTLAMAVSLRALGVARGDVVAVQLPNWHEFLIAHYACHAIGAATSPISPIYRNRDVARQLELSGARVLIVPGQFGNCDHAAMAMAISQEVATLRTVIVVGAEPPAGALAWKDLLRSGQAPEHEAERQRLGRGEDVPGLDDMMLLNFSSGTTGQPKGVMHSTHSVSSCVLPTIDRLQLSGDDVILVAPTLGHGGGFLNGLFMPTHLRAKVVYLDAWDAGFAIQVIEKERVTYGPVMPTYLYDLVAQPSLRTADLRSWVTGRVSGGAISRALMVTLQEILPQLRLCPGWGMSENLYSTCGSPDDPMEKRNSTEGRCVGDCVIEIRDSSFKRTLPNGEVGEIVTRASSLLLGYYGQDELTRASYTEDGWFKTGDLGRMDDEGYLTLVGRSKDLVIRGGENVPVVEVEQLLLELPAVAGAAVIGLPDARLGEKVCAVIELKDAAHPVTFEQMTAHLAGRGLTRQFIPQYLYIVASLPRTPSGKVRKQEVRADALLRFERESTSAT